MSKINIINTTIFIFHHITMQINYKIIKLFFIIKWKFTGKCNRRYIN